MWCPHLRASENIFPQSHQRIGGCREVVISWAGMHQGEGFTLGKGYGDSLRDRDDPSRFPVESKIGLTSQGMYVCVSDGIWDINTFSCF